MHFCEEKKLVRHSVIRISDDGSLGAPNVRHTTQVGIVTGRFLIVVGKECKVAVGRSVAICKRDYLPVGYETFTSISYR